MSVIAHTAPRDEKERPHRVMLSLIKFTIIAFLIITPFRFFVVQPFIVSGASMEPTLGAREYLVIDRLSYRYQTPARGDIAIFRYPLDPAYYFIKRIVGLPGEIVRMEKNDVYITGADGIETRLEEPYRIDDNASDEAFSITLSNDEYFMLGDNRAESSDSRKWGPLASRFLVGRALTRLYPLTDLEWFPGEYRYGE